MDILDALVWTLGLFLARGLVLERAAECGEWEYGCQQMGMGFIDDDCEGSCLYIDWGKRCLVEGALVPMTMAKLVRICERSLRGYLGDDGNDGVAV